MRCIHPIRLFDTGHLTEKGKVAYIYDSTGATSISPTQAAKCGYHEDHFLTEYREVPCGVCVACRKNRARSWQFRCLAELTSCKQNGQDSYFLTLTYDDDHNPGVLVKKDVQDFNKRLRKAVGPFRFYACGEYGDTTYRPHYHGIYFGLALDDLALYAKRGSTSLFVSDSLSHIWGKGFVVVGSVTPASCSYVAGYVSKKFDTPGVFSLMSRRPGIGLPWFRAHSQPGEFCVLPSGDGRAVKGSVPRSAFPDAVLDSSIVDVDEYSVGPLDRVRLDEFRWAMDFALKHPASKNRFRR